MSVWFVTGPSRGLGRALTASALAHGDQVAAAARDPRRVVDAFPDAGDALLPVPLDVTVAEQRSRAVDDQWRPSRLSETFCRWAPMAWRAPSGSRSRRASTMAVCSRW
jgi:hypothetical protein